MVYSEQVRQLSKESNLVNDPTTYTRNNAAWGTIHDYGNVTISEAGFLVFLFETAVASSFLAYFRLKVGASFYGWGKREFNTSYQTGFLFCYLNAGTYDILMECKGSGTGYLKNFQCGFMKLSDLHGSALALYSSTLNLTVSNRTTCIGALKNSLFVVEVWAYTPGGQTNFEDPGDSFTNGVSLAVDAEQITWTDRNQDVDSAETASAKYYCSLSVGSSHSFAITKDNANTVVHITITASPWLLYDVNTEPVTLNFSQASTLYLVLEPLEIDTTKYVYLGKVRAIDLGAATNYYSSSSGTGILSYSYSFETVKVGDVSLFLKGACSVVGIIGVDER